MWVLWVVRGDVWTPHVERIEGAAMTQAGGAYPLQRPISPDDPAIDLQPETARTVPGLWLIDGERGRSRSIWRFVVERFHLNPGGVVVSRTGAHEGDAGAGWVR